MAKWFYVIDGQPAGPVEPAALKQLATAGRLKPTDKVRREDLKEWYEARQVKGLFAAAQSQATTPTSSRGAEVLKPTPLTHANVQRVGVSPTARIESSTETAVSPAHLVLGQQAPTNSGTAFGSWYMERLGTKSIVLQLVLWILYGFFWIPAWWWITRDSDKHTKVNATILKRCAIVFVVAVSLAMMATALSRMMFPEYWQRLEAEVLWEYCTARSGESSSTRELPPPIAEALAAGKEVWLLQDYVRLTDTSGNRRYLVLTRYGLHSMVDAVSAPPVWVEWTKANEASADLYFKYSLRRSNSGGTLAHKGGDKLGTIDVRQTTTIQLKQDESIGEWSSEFTSDKTGPSSRPPRQKSRSSSGPVERVLTTK